MSTFAILLGGDVTPTARLKAQVSGARVIAADSGMAHAAALGLSPELWVGDFDSAGTALEAAYASVPRQVFPAAKNATDGEIAIDEALKRGATSLLLVGGFGGQFDHAMAHAMQLVSLENKGIATILSSGHEEARLLRDELVLPGLPERCRLSLIPLSDLAGLTLAHVRWPLTARDVPLGSTLTLSNEADGVPALSLREGLALVLVYPS